MKRINYNDLKGGSPPLDPNAPEHDMMGFKQLSNFLGFGLLVLVGVILISRRK
jgi:hypothetical protein